MLVRPRSRAASRSTAIPSASTNSGTEIPMRERATMMAKHKQETSNNQTAMRIEGAPGLDDLIQQGAQRINSPCPTFKGTPMTTTYASERTGTRGHTVQLNNIETYY